MTTAGDHSTAAVRLRLRHKRIFRLLRCFIIGTVLHVPFVLLFSFTILKVRNPKFRLGSVALQTLTVNSSSNSLAMTLTAQFTVKNTNFGPFKYSNATAVVSYRGIPVGVAGISGGQAGLRSVTKRDGVITVLMLGIGDDVDLGKVTLTAEATVNGKVEILLFMKRKKKSVAMNCTINVNTVAKSVDDLLCT